MKVNGQEAWLGSGNCRLPVEVGRIQIDCPAVGRLAADASNSGWALSKAARFRCWPSGSPWFEPGAFELPVRMRWFATDTQRGNEPTYVNGGDIPAPGRIYYHNDLDFGGAEGLEEVTAATDAVVVSARGEALPGPARSPVRPRQHVVYPRDGRGWFYRYSHHQAVDRPIRPGARVRQGQSASACPARKAEPGGRIRTSARWRPSRRASGEPKICSRSPGRRMYGGTNRA